MTDKRSDDSDDSVEDMWRMDLVAEPISEAEREGDYYRVPMALQPNPERYDRVDDENGSGWLDTYDNVFIPDDVLRDGWESMEDTPIYYDPPDVDDMSDYIIQRQEHISGFLDGPQQGIYFEGDSEQIMEYLQSLQNPGFVILSADMVGSTDFSSQMEPERYVKLTQLVISECLTLVSEFKGYTLNVAGDGFLAFFPEPNITGMHDNALDCAESLQFLITYGINPLLQERGYPPAHFRIGLNSGNPKVVVRGDDTDILGHTVNLASKIQSSASPGEILLGEITEEKLHTQWRKNTEQVTKEKDWEYTLNGELYDIFRYNYEW